MTALKNRCIILLITIISTISHGQVELKTYSPKQMQKDLDRLLLQITAHPDPYTKISEDDFQLLVEEVRADLRSEQDEIDLYKGLCRIITAIHDGHTSLRMPKHWLKNKRKKHGVVPLEVYLTDDNSLHVIDAYVTDIVPKGAKILSINGMPTEEFVQQCDALVSYETIPFRNDRITSQFELMLYLIFKTTEDLSITYSATGQETRTVPLLPYKEWKKLQKDNREEREKKIAKGKPYDFDIIAPGVGKLDIYSFAVEDLDRFNFFLSKTFSKVKENGVHSLIIDVRGNYGGWPKASSEIFHYIHEGYFKTIAKSSTKISYPYRRAFTEVNPWLKKANFIYPSRRHFVDMQAVIQGDLETYVDEDQFFNETPITETHEFTGDCFVLIDRKSYSAASSFAATFQCYSMGYLIGEPTGGTKIFRANAFGSILPKSNFRLSMATTKMYSTCYNEEDSPITPNIVAPSSVNERIHGVDAPLNMALRLIKKLQDKKEEIQK